MNNNHINSKGQTLIEMVIATMIIIVVVTAILGLVTNLLIVSSSSKYKTQASFLAQEVIEIVNNIRDTDLNKVLPWGTNFYTNDGWYKLNTYNETTGWTLTFLSSTQMTDGTTLAFDGKTFNRYIKVSNVGGDANKKEIYVEVQWSESKGIGIVKESAILTNWQ